MITHEERRFDLEQEVEEWKGRLRKALLITENEKRMQMKLPPYPESTYVELPSGVNANLQLLNLKVWCLRYQVTPEFLLEQILFFYSKLRKTARLQEGVYIGLPASNVVAVGVRVFIEESVKRVYPNNENRKILSQPLPSVIPVDNSETVEEMLESYKTHIQKAQEKFDINMNRQSKQIRSYRRVLSSGKI